MRQDLLQKRHTIRLEWHGRCWAVETLKPREQNHADETLAQNATDIPCGASCVRGSGVCSPSAPKDAPVLRTLQAVLTVGPVRPVLRRRHLHVLGTGAWDAAV